MKKLTVCFLGVPEEFREEDPKKIITDLLAESEESGSAIVTYKDYLKELGMDDTVKYAVEKDFAEKLVKDHLTFSTELLKMDTPVDELVTCCTIIGLTTDNTSYHKHIINMTDDSSLRIFVMTDPVVANYLKEIRSLDQEDLELVDSLMHSFPPLVRFLGGLNEALLKNNMSMDSDFEVTVSYDTLTLNDDDVQ